MAYITGDEKHSPWPFLTFLAIMVILIAFSTNLILIPGITGKIVDAEITNVSYHETGMVIYWLSYQATEDGRFPPPQSMYVKSRNPDLGKRGDTMKIIINRYCYNLKPRRWIFGGQT